MRVSNLMSRNVATIGESATRYEVVDQKCRRIVTDGDVRHRLLAPDVYRQIGEVPVSTLLRPSFVASSGLKRRGVSN
jgi:hypothetical protein